MVSKTRKRNQKRRATRRKGGAIDKLPNITNRTTLKEFNENYDVIYIRAHGLLLNTKFTVPKDTYILNSVPSTKTCVLSVRSATLNKFYENDYAEDFMSFIKKPRNVFPSIYNPAMIETLRRSGESAEVTSIYEPGEKNIYDVLLQFKSHVVPTEDVATKGVTHFIVPGIFKLPIARAVKNRRNELSDSIVRMLSMRRPSTNVEKELIKANREFTSLRGNLLNAISSRHRDRKEFHLSELLTFDEFKPAKGKKLFIIIHACRSTSLPNAHIRRVRAESMNRIIKAANARAYEEWMEAAAAELMAEKKAEEERNLNAFAAELMAEIKAEEAARAAGAPP